MLGHQQFRPEQGQERRRVVLQAEFPGPAEQARRQAEHQRVPGQLREPVEQVREQRQVPERELVVRLGPGLRLAAGLDSGQSQKILHTGLKAVSISKAWADAPFKNL